MYVLIGQTGGHSDTYNWVGGVFHCKSRAYDTKSMFNKILLKNGLYQGCTHDYSTLYLDPDLGVEEIIKLDEKFSCILFDRSFYSIEEVNVLDEPIGEMDVLS